MGVPQLVTIHFRFCIHGYLNCRRNYLGLSILFSRRDPHSWWPSYFICCYDAVVDVTVKVTHTFFAIFVTKISQQRRYGSP